MNRYWTLVAGLGALVLGGALSRQGQAQSQDLEQQLRSQYHLTRVGTNGRVVGEAGSILVIQQDGLAAIPASYGAYWYSTFKNGGRIKTSFIQHGGSVASTQRLLQVGEKAYLINMEIAAAEIVFYVQSCGECDVSALDPREVPYRARLAIQFDKGYLVTADAKQVVETIGQVLAIDNSTPRQESQQPPPNRAPSAPPPAATLKLPSSYANAQTPSDRLRLNADNTFSLQEAGQAYSGTFVVNGGALKLSISGGSETTVTIQGNNLTDSSGQTWVLAEQSMPAVAAEAIVHNEEVIKMVKAGLDDALVIAKIASSKCQFDTSTDALIQLKQSGVSAAVLKAMVDAAK